MSECLTESKKILTRRRREYFPVPACSRRLRGNKASAWRFSFFQSLCTKCVQAH